METNTDNVVEETPTLTPQQQAMANIAAAIAKMDIDKEPVFTDIKFFPASVLRAIAQPVEEFDGNLDQQIADMFYTMKVARGIGLAANQIGRLNRVVVMDASPNQDNPIVLVNPVILEKSDELVKLKEGCLSIPGQAEPVERPKTVLVGALNREGKPFEFEADGLMSACVQHEIDHLNGILFLDHLTQLRQNRVKKKMRQFNRRMDQAKKRDKIEASRAKVNEINGGATALERFVTRRDAAKAAG